MFSRTKRLLLRPGWAEDAPALSRVWNDEAIVRNLPDLPANPSVEATAQFLLREREALSPYFLLFARTGGAPRLIGGCGIGKSGGKGCGKTADQADDDRPELSFWLARPFWGLGFATEAAAAVTRMARASGIRDLIARPTTDNIAATRVLAKLGFQPTGRTEQRHSRARGGMVACALFQDSGRAPMRVDSSRELYMDRAPIAA
ncbi:MAG: GNAT family N-acetyltransferase [Sphingobium sp.]